MKAGFDLPEFYQEIVADELNVKNVKFTDDVRDFTSYSFKPQLKTVGPKYGKMLGGIKAALDQPTEIQQWTRSMKQDLLNWISTARR